MVSRRPDNIVLPSVQVEMNTSFNVQHEGFPTGLEYFTPEPNTLLLSSCFLKRIEKNEINGKNRRVYWNCLADNLGRK